MFGLLFTTSQSHIDSITWQKRKAQKGNAFLGGFASLVASGEITGSIDWNFNNNTYGMMMDANSLKTLIDLHRESRRASLHIRASN